MDVLGHPEVHLCNMLDSLHETVLNSILRELDLSTLATVEAISTTLRNLVRTIAIPTAVIISPRTTCFSSPINTPDFQRYISWLKRHAHQFHAAVIVENDPDAAGAIGIALAGAHNLSSLRTVSNSVSSWKIPTYMMYATAPSRMAPLTTLKLGRGSNSPGFLQSFSKTLQSLVITVSTMEQTRDVLSLNLPEMVDLRVGASCSMPLVPSESGGGVFPKLRYLTLSNIDFRSRIFSQGPLELDSLVLITCNNVQCSGLSWIPIVVHLGVHGMQFPTDMNVCRLQELEVSHLAYSFPDISLPNLRRFQGSYSDISIKLSRIPKIWTAVIGQGCSGDKRWLLKVPQVFL